MIYYSSMISVLIISASASLDSVTKLFEQVKAVKELNLGRREMFKMLTQSVPSASGKDLNEKPGDDGNDSDGESDIVDFDASMSENWKKVGTTNFAIFSVLIDIYQSSE